MDYKQQKDLIGAAKLLSSDYERAFGMYDRWLEYNWEIFDGVLDPLVIMVHEVACYGKQLGHYSPCNRKIFIWDTNNPNLKDYKKEETLLHEMGHQYQREIMGWRPLDEKDDCHNNEAWCDVWNEIILPKTGHGEYCVALRKRTKRNSADGGPQKNVNQLVWVPSCGDRIPVPYDVVSSMGHPHLYRPATEEWAKGCGPYDVGVKKQPKRVETLLRHVRPLEAAQLLAAGY